MTEAPDIGITLHALRRYIERVVGCWKPDEEEEAA